MNDFQYDVYRKKSIAHSATRRKCGSKSKKCNLSTDHMTEKEWKERCGDVMSYNIGKPMTWAEFQRLPKDLKEEYLNNLINKYSANARSMADMFGVNPNTIFRVVKSNELNVKFLKGKHPVGEKAVAFQKFLDGENCLESEEVVENPQEPAEEEHVEETQSDAVKQTKLDSFTMNFSGEVDIDMISNSLRYILGSGRTAKIQIICELD